VAIVVQKFGGSSLSDLEKLGKVADWVATSRRSGLSLVVVVSAMGKTTEALLDLACQAAVRATPEAEFAPPRRELDMLVTTGERVSMALLAIALEARGIPAVSLTGSQTGIVTSERHFDARILDVQPWRLEAELFRGRVVVVAGYQGVSRSGEITTLGRGGSDTSAVALAAALGAQRCEIYSDVDGVYTADPHSVSSARHLPELDYDTLLEMADAGARVVNSRAVGWGQRHGIPIYARATQDFTSGSAGRQTQIVDAAPAHSTRAIVLNSKLALISAAAEASDALRSAVERAELPLRDVALQGACVRATIPLFGVPDFGRASAALNSAKLPGYRLEAGLSELSAIGANIGADVTRYENALDTLGTEPRLTVVTPRRISVVAPTAIVQRAEAEWHRLFVEAA
jgi:aspartate kinase